MKHRSRSKKKVYGIRAPGDSGIILASALWIVIILSLMAAGLGRNTSVDLSLLKYTIAKAKSYHAARAGIQYAVALLSADSKDDKLKSLDTLYECGLIVPQGSTPDALLTHIPVGRDSYFDIKYQQTEPSAHSQEFYAGFQDEESRLNLNAINSNNYKLLSSLIVSLGFSEEEALTIAASVADWHDDDSIVTQGSEGAESDWYAESSKPYKCKNKPFDSVEELMLVKGMRQEVFRKLKDFVTIFPQETPKPQINFNTASPQVMQAFIEFSLQSGGLSGTQSDKMAEKILQARKGKDQKIFTEDDEPLPVSGSLKDMFDLSASEEVFYFQLMQTYHKPVSNYLRLNVTGYGEHSSIETHLAVVIDRERMAIVEWHRD